MNNGKEEIGQILFRMDGSIGVYIKQPFLDRISRRYLRNKLENNYTLGLLGRENTNRMKPSRF